jgi:hypothetical protein
MGGSETSESEETNMLVRKRLFWTIQSEVLDDELLVEMKELVCI